MLIKKYGARFNKGLKIINLRDILLLSFFAFSLLIQAFGTADLAFDFRRIELEALFSVYSRLARTDYQFRSGLQAFTDTFVLANLVVLTEAYGPYMSPEERTYRPADSLFIHEQTVKQTGETDVFSYMSRELAVKKLRFSLALNEFKRNELLGGLASGLKDSILKNRVDYDSYLSFTSTKTSSHSVSGPVFLGLMKAGLERFEEDLRLMGKEALRSAPPYGIPPTTLKSRFDDQLPPRFSLMRNAWNGSLEFHSATLKTLSHMMLVEQKAVLDRTNSISAVVTSVLLAVFLAACYLFAASTSSKLLELLSQYRNLRGEELGQQLATLKDRATQYSKYKLHEQKLMEHFIRAITVFSSPEQPSAKQPAKPSAAQRSNPRLKGKVRFRIFFVMACSSIILILLMSYVFLVVTSSRGLFARVVNILRLYIDIYESFSESYNYYMAEALFFYFGNFISIQGHLTSDFVRAKQAKSPLRRLSSLIVEKRDDLKTIFDQKKSGGIDEFLFSHACKHIDPEVSYFARKQKLCSESQFAAKGFVSFLNSLQDFILELTSASDSQVHLLPRSLNEWWLFSTRTFLYESPRYKQLILNDLMFDTFFSELLSAGESALVQAFREAQQSIVYVNRASSIVVLVVVTCSFYLALYLSITHDQRICSETLFNMLPEIIVQNKLILRIFDETYSLKY